MMQKKNQKQQKKKNANTALVLPFHRMKIVERKQPSFQSLIQKLGKQQDEDEESGIIEMELNELLNIIHNAALDPNIVALYGTFGKGYQFQSGGYAHVEEIRNAIRVFNESHRDHYEPLSSRIGSGDGEGDAQYGENNEAEDEGEEHDDNEPMKRQKEKRKQKLSFAFADTFGNPIDPGNKEYYLASAFTNIHMQNQGDLNMYGIGTTSPFLKGMLDKYGVKVHVFRHGKYKNAPNIFTDSAYTKEHRQNMTSIIESIDEHIINNIIQSRSLYNVAIDIGPSSSSNKSEVGTIKMSDRKIWDNLRDYGTLTGDNAIEIGLIDELSLIDPLDSLLIDAKEKNKRKIRKKSRKRRKNGNGIGGDSSSTSTSNSITDDDNSEKDELNHFRAEKKISLLEYSSLLKKKSKVEETKWKIRETMDTLSRKSSMTETVFGILGYSAPNFNVDEDDYNKNSWKINKEKIAVVNITGAITDSIATSVIQTLRKIKDDKNVKCVVLRVDSPGGSSTASELIHQECKHLPQPVVCSLSNTAASGGYYVAANADRIFALPTTVTGSIGVFGIKLDMSELASSYGVKFDCISTGIHSTANGPFQPLTKKMEMNFSRNVDRVYDQFKQVVASGRSLDLDYVQLVAQGRVWTGEQAKEIGLVDELGGISRAISYAKRNHTSDGDADVEMWPKRKTLMEKISKLLGDNSDGKGMLLFNIIWDEAISLVSDNGDERQNPTSNFESDLFVRRLLADVMINGGVDQLYHHALGTHSIKGGPHANILLTMNETDAISMMLQD
mmetsp:Transcript_22047/g.31996  ORF Transcript_22047/g.31996 Transcript_22047/m.31996 type:complete len:782 (-) Transcript_22047:600-2945(-)